MHPQSVSLIKEMFTTVIIKIQLNISKNKFLFDLAHSIIQLFFERDYKYSHF